MRRIRWIAAMLVVVILLAMTAPGLVAATANPIVDLAGAVAYWQEQAITAAVERDKLKDELECVTAERDELRRDVATLEMIVTRLQSERDEALLNAKSEASLREQAERDLEYAMTMIDSLNMAVAKLAGPRFGLIFGATYDIRARDPGLLAGLQWTFR